MSVGQIILTLVVAIIGSSALATVVQLLVQRHYAQKDKENDKLNIIEFALGALAHDSYFNDCRKLIKKDAITEEELDNHNYLYKAYHALGLNGTGDRMHEIILDKPVMTKDE